MEIEYHIKVKEAKKRSWWFLSDRGTSRLRIHALVYRDLTVARDVADRLEFATGVSGAVRVVTTVSKRVMYERIVEAK